MLIFSVKYIPIEATVNIHSPINTVLGFPALSEMGPHNNCAIAYPAKNKLIVALILLLLAFKSIRILSNAGKYISVAKKPIMLSPVR
ncbi:hypothetical protein D3C87_1544110 [compost metagenome]